jgi:hypothetical protein
MGAEAAEMFTLVQTGTATAESVRQMIAVSQRERSDLISLGLREFVRRRETTLAEFDALVAGAPVKQAAERAARPEPRQAPRRCVSAATRERIRQRLLCHWARRKAARALGR